MVAAVLLLASACGSGSGELETLSGVAETDDGSDEGSGLSSETVASDADQATGDQASEDQATGDQASGDQATGDQASEDQTSEGEAAAGTDEADGSEAPLAQGDDPAGDGCSAEDFFCVGLVTDLGAVDDGTSHNGVAWEAVENSGADEVDAVETADPADHGANIQTLVERDYDVIVTVGADIGSATVQAATANPDVSFIGVDQESGAELANLATVVFAEDQLGFLAGAMAGLMTESGTVGAVFGTDLDPGVRDLQDGFSLGLRHTNTDAELVIRFHPGAEDIAFTDPSWGAESARQALDSGADVVFGTGGSTGVGALEEVARDGAALCIGVDRDQWGEALEARPCLVTSAVKLVGPAVGELLASVVAGDFVGGDVNGRVGLADYRTFDSDVPTDVKIGLAELTEEIATGQVETSDG